MLWGKFFPLTYPTLWQDFAHPIANPSQTVFFTAESLLM